VNILLAFAPFLVFAILNGFVGGFGALLAAAATSAALILYGWMKHSTPKILEIGTFLLFVALAAYVATTGGTQSIIGVKLLVDSGLLLIVLLSMAIGQPFTIQYAKETVPREYWNSPKFLRTNYVITAVWAIAFLAIVLVELALLYVPGMSRHFSVFVMIAALVGAIKFTTWYPKHQKETA